MTISVDELDVPAIERACQRLVLDSAIAIDLHRFHDVALLFSENGTFQRANGDVLNGRAEIECGLNRPADHVTIHHVSPTAVDADGPGTARGTTSFVAYIPAQEIGASIIAAVAAFWDDRFISTPAGWRIVERRTRVLKRPTISAAADRP